MERALRNTNSSYGQHVQLPVLGLLALLKQNVGLSMFPPAEKRNATSTQDCANNVRRQQSV